MLLSKLLFKVKIIEWFKFTRSTLMRYRYSFEMKDKHMEINPNRNEPINK
jgi:hypothetical protein